MKTLPSLDGLRAVAVTLVFLAHAGFGHRVPGGFGVTLFFVVSGYLITGLLLAEWHRHGCLDLPRFYARRFLRLLPALLAVVTIAVFLTLTGVLGGRVSATGVAAALLHFSNYYFILGDFDGLPAGLGVLWSLAVEEHFYLLFPPAMAWVLRRQEKDRLVTWVALTCLLILAWRLWLQQQGASEAWLSMATDTRADAILAGVLLALLTEPFTSKTRRHPPLLTASVLAGAVIVLVGTLLWRTAEFRFGWRYSIQALAIMPIVYLAVTESAWPVFRPLNTPLALWIGQRSYGIYLVHHVVLEGVHRHWPQATPWGRMLAGAALTLLLAALLYATIEAPAARWRHRLQARQPRVFSPFAPPRRISVCVATYRRPQKLALLLADLARQSLPPCEVIVVDNDPAGSALSVVERMRASGAPGRWVYASESQQNISLARNRSIMLARQEWLAFVDDDERAPATWLQGLADCAGAYAADGVLGPVLPVLPEDAAEWLQRGGLHEWPRMPTGTVVPANRLRFGNVLLRREHLIRQPGPFDPAFGLTGGEDGDLLNRLRQAGARIIWCDEAWVQEPVDRSRLKLRWLWWRALRGGQDHARHLLLGRYGQKNAIQRLGYFARAVGQVLVAGILALITVGAARHQGVRWLLRMSANLGKLSVLGGWHYREYAGPRA